MIDIDVLPSIEGGTVRQQMLAENIRLNFITFIEEIQPEFLEPGKIVLELRTQYKWWIDKTFSINAAGVKSMISAANKAVKTHGSVEAAKAHINAKAKSSQEYLLNSKILGGILE